MQSVSRMSSQFSQLSTNAKVGVVAAVGALGYMIFKPKKAATHGEDTRRSASGARASAAQVQAQAPPDAFVAAGARVDDRTRAELDDAWFELESASRDARRHTAYLISQLDALRNRSAPTTPEAAAAWQELAGGIADSQAHADFVEESVERYKKLTQDRLGGRGSSSGNSSSGQVMR
jgi:hypothetical protein